MSETYEIDGKTVHARSCTRKEWIDLSRKHEDPDDFQDAVMAACVLDDNDEPAFTLDEIRALPIPKWKRLDNLLTKAHRAEDLEKN